MSIAIIKGRLAPLGWIVLTQRAREMRSLDHLRLHRQTSRKRILSNRIPTRMLKRYIPDKRQLIMYSQLYQTCKLGKWTELSCQTALFTRIPEWNIPQKGTVVIGSQVYQRRELDRRSN